ncbi:MAG: hypothetical protein GX144_07765 [Clostridiaceae bacterium]|jgi:hypothetical protein|nr:hypothetical protein [Clostridiaceae bacterium]
MFIKPRPFYLRRRPVQYRSMEQERSPEKNNEQLLPNEMINRAMPESPEQVNKPNEQSCPSEGINRFPRYRRWR